MNANNSELCAKTNIMFSFVGETVAPHEITRLLGLTPTTAYAKDDVYEVPRVGKRRRASGHWSLCTEGIVNSTDVSLHAAHLLDELLPCRAAILRLLSTGRYQVTISIWWELRQLHGRLAIQSSVLRALAELSHEISFHFLASSPDD